MSTTPLISRCPMIRGPVFSLLTHYMKMQMSWFCKYSPVFDTGLHMQVLIRTIYLIRTVH